MKNLSNPTAFIIVLFVFTLFASCKKGEVIGEFDCGPVETEILEMRDRVGSYTANNFTSSSSTDFEVAAFATYVNNFRIITQTEKNCLSYTSIPQLIESMTITSANTVTSGGVEFTPNEDLNALFKLHYLKQTYSVSAFITAQNEGSVMFGDEGDEIVLQLLNQPDATINQPFAIQLTFDDLKVINIEIPTFEVIN